MTAGNINAADRLESKQYLPQMSKLIGSLLECLQGSNRMDT